MEVMIWACTVDVNLCFMDLWITIEAIVNTQYHASMPSILYQQQSKPNELPFSQYPSCIFVESRINAFSFRHRSHLAQNLGPTQTTA